MNSVGMNSNTATHDALQFRAATPADIDALVALVESAYRGDASRVGWTTEADLLDGRRTGADDIAACIERERSILLVLERVMAERMVDGHKSELLACAHLAVEHADEHHHDKQPAAGYFGMFSVRPQLQGSGLGKLMLAEAERIMRDDWQLPLMRMTVIDVRDELIAFYERRGYRRTGIHKPFPYGDERFGIPRRDDLRFEVLEKALSRETASLSPKATSFGAGST